jgi:hypothetical protein
MTEDAPPTQSRALIVAAYIALAIVAAVSTVYTIHHAFPHGSGVLDEASYQAQANALGAHHLTLPAKTHEPFFRPFLSGVRGDHVVFKYQPAWPALIAVSDGVFGSSVPMRALLSIAGMLAVAWFAWELTRDARVALLAGLLVVASPFVWVQTASLLAYHLSFVLGTAAVAALLRALRTRQWWITIVAGALLGFAIVHRPFDALLAVVPVLVYVTVRAWKTGALARLAAGVAIGGVPFAIVFLAYNRAVMGSILTMPFSVSGKIDTFGFGWRASFEVPGGGRGGQIHYTPTLALETLRHVFAILPRFLGLFPLIIVGLIVVIWIRRRDARLWLLVSMMVIIIVGYFFWWGSANAFHFHLEKAMGPFYHYPLLPPLFVAAAWGFWMIRSSNLRILLLLAGVVWSGWTIVSVVRDARVDGQNRSAEVAALTAAPPKALVLETPLFPNDPYVRYANDANLTGNNLVAVDMPGRRLEVIDRFPGYTPYLFRAYRSLDDPFGDVHEDRIPMSVQHAPSMDVHMTAHPKDGRAATSYIRIGDDPPTFGPSGTGTIDFDNTLNGASLHVLPTGIREVAVGFTVAPPGAPAPTTMTGEWYECRFEARAYADGTLETLTPCEGWHQSFFPGGATATSVEDLSSVLDVQVKPAS